MEHKPDTYRVDAASGMRSAAWPTFEPISKAPVAGSAPAPRVHVAPAVGAQVVVLAPWMATGAKPPSAPLNV